MCIFAETLFFLLFFFVTKYINTCNCFVVTLVLSMNPIHFILAVSLLPPSSTHTHTLHSVPALPVRQLQPPQPEKASPSAASSFHQLATLHVSDQLTLDLPEATPPSIPLTAAAVWLVNGALGPSLPSPVRVSQPPPAPAARCKTTPSD